MGTDETQTTNQDKGSENKDVKTSENKDTSSDSNKGITSIDGMIDAFAQTLPEKERSDFKASLGRWKASDIRASAFENENKTLKDENELLKSNLPKAEQNVREAWAEAETAKHNLDETGKKMLLDFGKSREDMVRLAAAMAGKGNGNIGSGAPELDAGGATSISSLRGAIEAAKKK